MRGPLPSRLLPALLLIAALSATAQAPSGQIPAKPAGTAPAGKVSAPSSVLPASPGDLRLNPAAAQQPAAPAVSKPQPLSPEQQGDLLQAQKHYQAAIASYSQVKPATATVWNKMGIAYQLLFNVRDAQRCYKESIKLDPHNATTVNNLATTYDNQKQYKQAEKMYRKAVKIDPKSAVIYKNLGTNLLTQHKYSKGLEAYNKAMALDPQIFADRDSPRVTNPTNVQDRGALNYYMALGCLRSGQTDCTLEYLRNALDEGYITPKKLATDDQFLSLRDNPAFQRLLAEQQQQKQ